MPGTMSEDAYVRTYLKGLEPAGLYEPCDVPFHGSRPVALTITIVEEHQQSPRSFIDPNSHAIQGLGAGLLIISGIDNNTIGRLGTHYGIDPNFFVQHALSDIKLAKTGPLKDTISKCGWHLGGHVDGSFLLSQQEGWIVPEPLAISPCPARISFYRIKSELCEFS